MAHHCEVCDYVTDIHSNMVKHKQSSKHLEAIKNFNIYLCPNCPRKFNQLTGLSRHQKTCDQNAVVGLTKNYEEQIKKLKIEHENEMRQMKDQYQDNINELEKINIRLQTDNENLNHLIDVLTKDKSDYKDMATGAGSIAKTSMNAVSYAMHHFKNTPVIEPFSKFELLNVEKKFKLHEVVLFHYENKQFSRYLVTIFEQEYKKDDTEQQQFWNTDSSRLVYIVRQAINGIPQWIPDKAGELIIRYVAKPALEFVKKDMREYIMNVVKAVELDPGRMVKEHSRLLLANNLITEIDDNTIASEIIKLMAPKFYLNKVKAIKE